MSTEKLRRVTIKGSTPAYFHMWLKKTYAGDDGSKDESAYALVELEDGTIKEVVSYEVKFVD